MNRLIIIIFILLITSNNLFANQTITICGTGDSQSILRILANSYENLHPNTKILIPDSIGSSGGIKDTANGKCDLGRISREIKEKEKIYNLNYVLFAYSPIVFVTNANINNINNINEKDLINIFNGNIKEWNYLNNKIEGKIFIINREESDSSREILKKNLPGFDNIKEYAGKTFFSTPDTIQAIQKYKNTIGYVPLSETINTNLNILNLNNIKPDKNNVLSGKYKLLSSFGIVYKGTLNPLSKSFIHFLQSKDAQAIIEKNNLISNK